MAIFRVERTKDYTVMCNHHLRDMNLSLKSKGLLSMMLSLPDDWNFSTKGLAAICKEGVEAIGTGLKELERAGYILRRQLHGEHGRITDIVYESRVPDGYVLDPTPQYITVSNGTGNIWTSGGTSTGSGTGTGNGNGLTFENDPRLSERSTCIPCKLERHPKRIDLVWGTMILPHGLPKTRGEPCGARWTMPTSTRRRLRSYDGLARGDLCNIPDRRGCVANAAKLS